MAKPAFVGLGLDGDELSIDPRILRTRRVVLAATIDLVAEQGCDRATIDAISERAKVSRTTIYRHWPRRPELLLDALRAIVEPQPEFDTGSLRTDLVELVAWINDFLSSSRFGAALVAMLESARREPMLSEEFDRFLEERRRHGRSIFQRAIDRGELPADVDVDTVLGSAMAPAFYAAIVRRQPLTRDDVERFVSWALEPLRSP